jgi:hypothetical protein
VDSLDPGSKTNAYSMKMLMVAETFNVKDYLALAEVQVIDSLDEPCLESTALKLLD